MNYHRVIPEEFAQRDHVEPGTYVPHKSFRMQLEALGNVLRVVPLHEFANRLIEARPLPARPCAITFDDGWLNNCEFAYLKLKGAELPAAFFL